MNSDCGRGGRQVSKISISCTTKKVVSLCHRHPCDLQHGLNLFANHERLQFYHKIHQKLYGKPAGEFTALPKHLAAFR